MIILLHLYADGTQLYIKLSVKVIARAWPETAPDIRPGRISGFKELFALANNTHANTCVYLSLMRPGYLLPRNPTP